MTRTEALVERARELAAVAAARERAKTAGEVLLIEGPAGIGKSRLVEAARDEADGYRTSFARAGVLEQDIGFGVVRQLLERPLASAGEAERLRLLEGAAAGAAHVIGASADTDVPPGGDPAASLHALFWLVANLAERSPLLLAVDDVHWADRVSLEFLAYLARRIEDLPVLVVVAARDGEPRRHEETISALAETATIVRPAPLSGEGVAELVRRSLGSSASPELVAACHHATGGNPFYVRELVASIRGGSEEGQAVAVDAVRDMLPSTVTRSILLRLGRLPEPAPKLARAAALLGDGTSLRTAGALAEIQPVEAERAADALVGASIFASLNPLRFEHPIVGAAIAKDIAPAERSAAHRRAAQLLHEGGATVERVAAQLLESIPSGDGWAAGVLHRAARDAVARGAPAIGARLLARAIEEGPAEGVAGLMRELSAAQLAAGEYADAAATAERATEVADEPAVRARIRLDLAYAVLSLSGPLPAMRILDEAVREAGDADPQLALALEGELAFQALLAHIPHPVLRSIGRHRDLAGNTHAERFMLAMLAVDALGRIAPASELRDLALRALAGGRLLEEASSRTMAYTASIWALQIAEAYGDAHPMLDAGMNDAISRGSRFGFAMVSWVRGMLAEAEGNLLDAEADERACIENAFPSMAEMARWTLAMILLEQGDLDGAVALKAACEAAGAGRPMFVRGRFVRGLILLAEGRAVEALADFDEVGRAAKEVGGFAGGHAWQAQRALALAALGDHDAAEEAAEHQAEIAEMRGAPAARGAAFRILGKVCEGPARIKYFDDAVALLEATPARLELSRAQFDLGVTLLRAGRRSQGRDILGRACDGARVCSARGLAQAAHEELRVAGARPRRLMFTGVESLTASERRVAALAADGMTNREIAQALFVTPKTVENQLGRVYAKLGVASRRDIGRVLGAPPASTDADE